MVPQRVASRAMLHGFPAVSSVANRAVRQQAPAVCRDAVAMRPMLARTLSSAAKTEDERKSVPVSFPLCLALWRYGAPVHCRRLARACPVVPSLSFSVLMRYPAR